MSLCLGVAVAAACKGLASITMRCLLFNFVLNLFVPGYHKTIKLTAAADDDDNDDNEHLECHVYGQYSLHS